MALLRDLVTLCRALEATSGRLEKRRLTAGFLAALTSGEIGTAVAFLTGRPFPPSDPRVLGVRGLPRPDEGAGPVAGERPLTLLDVAEAFAAVADTSGAGSRRLRD